MTDLLNVIDIDQGDEFGRSVAIGADSIAIGSLGDDGVIGDPSDKSAKNTGVVHTFPR